jgi:hypothetical protein
LLAQPFDQTFASSSLPTGLSLILFLGISLYARGIQFHLLPYIVLVPARPRTFDQNDRKIVATQLVTFLLELDSALSIICEDWRVVNKPVEKLYMVRFSPSISIL